MTKQPLNKLHHSIDTLWNFMSMGHKVEPSDCIFVLCSNDTRVAEYAAKLYHQKIAPYIVFSGGVGRFTEGNFDRSEAETFAAIARDCGVPDSDIVIEKHATNTGENVRFTHELLTELGLSPKKLTLVQKPFMEKRTYATFSKQWPEETTEITVTSKWQDWVDYFNEELPLDMVLGALVADFERIKSYPAKGFQIEMPIPEEVVLAYQAIKKLGFE
ncbi:YdcF family protein [Vibrio sp. Isolate31]|uniref:YdcF family protein n=1 Tax=unclassified Vibrio TaxID=2614977 RepID=UPI001EFD795F|nr:MULTISPECIES: YdcF family protein [unclassified Vibrio]MCG9553002.1 YdcF family protein [Vibrio sp. Isolate32]MCG9600105.1 YdcF family protein [Vibrio sp. Isolate31]